MKYILNEKEDISKEEAILLFNEDFLERYLITPKRLDCFMRDGMLLWTIFFHDGYITYVESNEFYNEEFDKTKQIELQPTIAIHIIKNELYDIVSFIKKIQNNIFIK